MQGFWWVRTDDFLFGGMRKLQRCAKGCGGVRKGAERFDGNVEG